MAIVLSAGPAEASNTVPDITGKSLADAQAAITEAGLVIGNSLFDTNPTVPTGKIVSQYPLAFTKVVSGTTVSVVISSGPATGVTIPPDPGSIAPDVDVPPLVDATEFIYTGPSPIQTGVPIGTIDSNRIAVLRGNVIDKNGLSLSGVNITVKDHPEFGQTYSRADGGFDLVVNGGGYLWVNYSKAGYLPSQRQISVPVQDYAWLPDVMLLQLDPVVTSVDLTSPLPMQVARGSVVTDTDGSRQATLLISAGTTAEMTLPDGNTVPITTLNIRATEYTVGDNGPKAMPGQLPPTTAYTYAVEFSADEAIAVEATQISFNRPLYAYVDDFMGFPAGSAVPAGYYDRQKGSWIASENGRVVKILGITAGMADLDVDGTNSAASDSSLALLNITEAERRTLAALYPSAPKQLWRVPITHFTPWDCNWPYGPPQDATSPPLITTFIEDDVDDPCTESGSLIECQNRALGESIPIQGTAYSLNYRSNLTAGYLPSRQIRIKLSEESLPASLQRIDVDVYIAGHRITRSFPALPNLVFDYNWDGRDCYGTATRSAYYTVIVSYVYPGVFYPVSTDIQTAFGQRGGRP